MMKKITETTKMCIESFYNDHLQSFLVGIPYKIEQPLQGMELQEKEEKMRSI